MTAFAEAISTNNTRTHGISLISRWCIARWQEQYGDDGVQLKWLAPAEMFVEIGGEIGRGHGFPGTDRQKNGSGARALFAHLGDDIGIEHSRRAWVSLHETRRENAVSDNVPDISGNLV